MTSQIANDMEATCRPAWQPPMPNDSLTWLCFHLLCVHSITLEKVDGTHQTWKIKCFHSSESVNVVVDVFWKCYNAVSDAKHQYVFSRAWTESYDSTVMKDTNAGDKAHKNGQFCKTLHFVGDNSSAHHFPPIHFLSIQFNSIQKTVCVPRGQFKCICEQHDYTTVLCNPRNLKK